MGFSFAAGTTDGPGAFDFKQGDTSGNAFWRFVSGFLKKPTPEQVACHHPKPILLDTGQITFPYEWQPHIVDIQILRIGQLIILSVPAEFTTMAGRRMRNTIRQILQSKGIIDDTGIVVIAGLANTYSDYVTTYEEYEIQRYEGASTAHGPFSLNAYIQEMSRLAEALASGAPVPPGPPPPDYSGKQVSLLPPVIEDTTPVGVKFGDVAKDVLQTYAPNDNVSVVFWSANPRNNLRTGSTFLTVERLIDNAWQVAFTDADWETRFYWDKPDIASAHSQATIVWHVPSDYGYLSTVLHRIRHFGTHKSLLGEFTDFSGQSSMFTITPQ
jgi:neutral ceramidase